MIFLPKCRAFNAVLENGHGAREKGMALEKRALRNAITLNLCLIMTVFLQDQNFWGVIDDPLFENLGVIGKFRGSELFLCNNNFYLSAVHQY